MVGFCGGSFFTFLRCCLQTKAAKAVMGKYYREPKKSGPIPFHLIGNLVKSINEDHYVSDNGDIVYYQTDPQLNAYPIFNNKDI